MKYVFASILVLVALVTVFHVEKVIPIPRAITCVMNSSVAKHMPFGVQKAYAESCLVGLEREQDRVRHTVSDTAVRLREIDGRIAGLRDAQGQSVSRMKQMVEHRGDVSESAVAAEIARHDDLQWKLTHASKTRDQLCAALTSLEQAEGIASRKMAEFTGRLDAVELDHVRNDARGLVAGLAGDTFAGKSRSAVHCANVITHMEHEERVREETHRRYSLAPSVVKGMPATDLWDRAAQIAGTGQ